MDRRHFIKLGIAGATVAVGGMLAGCAGGAEAPAPRSETHPQSQAETPSTSAATEPAAPKGTPVVTGNSLVIYYSHPEITAASDPANLTEAEENSAVVVDGEILGNTQFVAQIIARVPGGMHPRGRGRCGARCACRPGLQRVSGLHSGVREWRNFAAYGRSEPASSFPQQPCDVGADHAGERNGRIARSWRNVW